MPWKPSVKQREAAKPIIDGVKKLNESSTGWEDIGDGKSQMTLCYTSGKDDEAKNLASAVIGVLGWDCNGKGYTQNDRSCGDTSVLVITVPTAELKKVQNVELQLS